MAQISSARYLLVSILFVYVACVLGQYQDPRLKEVDGEAALPKEFPHIARLGHRNSNNETTWFCGGTLINKRLVLTAAHCLYSDNVINVVRLGELDFSTETDDAQPEDFGVKKVIEHPAYNYPYSYHDIAILQLNRPVNFNFYKHPACLPFESGNLSKSFIAIGWGQERFAGPPSKYLLKVELKNLWNKCATLDWDDLPRGYDYNSQLCVGSSDLKNTCNGDSGGPLLNYDREFPHIHYVTGIVSTGLGCNEAGFPTLYTRVYYYLNWIKQQMAIYT